MSVTGAGAGVDTVWEQKKTEATLREMLENRARPSGSPQRPVHIILVLVQDAVLGSALTRHPAQLQGDGGNPVPFHKICPCGFHP